MKIIRDSIGQCTGFSAIGLFLCLCLCLACSGTKKITSAFEKAPAFEKGFAGLVVFDPVKKRMIYQRNANNYFTPASNIKLFSFFTGLKILGDSVPALVYSVRNDSLIFSGTGDPSFLNPELPGSDIFEFLRSGDHQLYYYPAQQADAFFGPGWAWDDYNSYYAAERSAFPVYGNQIQFKITPGITGFEVFPNIFRDSVMIGKISFDNKPHFKREISGNQIAFSPGTVAAPHIQKIPFKYSTSLLVKLLSDTLNKEVKVLKHLPKDLTLNQVKYSIPMDSLYRKMLVESDNFIAEQLLFLSAHKISDTLQPEVAIEYMKENYLKDLPDEVFWVDGSGLSRYNLATPASIVKLLYKIQQEVPQERLLHMFATGGKSGTLKHSYIADPPYVFAKTGTLRNNHSLSGFLKARSGKLLIFSFMNSNYVVPTSELRLQMEMILRTLYQNN